MRVRRVTAEASGWGDTQVGPWTRHSRRIAYRNPWITVHHDEVTRPDGQPGIYGVVHYANVAVAVVAIDAQDPWRWSASTAMPCHRAHRAAGQAPRAARGEGGGPLARGAVDQAPGRRSSRCTSARSSG